MTYAEEHKREKQAAAAARYRERHLEKVKAQQKSWYDKDPQKSIARNKQWKRNNPEGEFNAYLRRKYGITREQYDKILNIQGGLCAICGGFPVGHTKKGKAVRFDVDHCHRTGIVRGLLCHPCNVMLGQSKDRIDVLEKAARYLREHGRSIDVDTGVYNESDKSGGSGPLDAGTGSIDSREDSGASIAT